jgi:uncharacterized membrane protein
MGNLSNYEQELKDKYVENEEFFKVGKNTVVCVLSIKGGFEYLGHCTDNANNKSFSEDELKEKACKMAYEGLENYDRFHSSVSK